jgi:hypothetical protein
VSSTNTCDATSSQSHETRPKLENEFSAEMEAHNGALDVLAVLIVLDNVNIDSE